MVMVTTPLIEEEHGGPLCKLECDGVMMCDCFIEEMLGAGEGCGAHVGPA